MAQAKGSNASLLLYKEDSFGVAPAVIAAVACAFNSVGLKAERNLITPATIRGNATRNPIQPSQGNKKVTGNMVVPVDLRIMGYFLQGLIGLPTSTQAIAKALTNGGAAVDVGAGVTGLPCVGHGFQAGETITIANTTNYNGDEVVLASSTVNQINITAAYVAENMGATSTARAKRYTHVFTLDDELYSYGLEIGFGDINQFFLYPGSKLDKLNLKVGGDGELLSTIDVVSKDESLSGASCDAAPTELTFSRYSQFQASLLEDTVAVTVAKEFELNIMNNLESDKYCIGGGGQLGSIPEGLCNVNGKISAMFEDGTRYTKALNATITALQLVFTYGVYSLTFDLAELNYKLGGPGVATPQGIWADMDFEAFHSSHADNSVVKATLVNDVAAYTW